MSDDSHALSGAYAVGAVDDVERAQFERHLAVCAECRADVASFRMTTTQLSLLTATAPPPALRARVLREVRRVRPLPPDVGQRTAPAAAGSSTASTRSTVSTRTPSTRRWLAAAAAAVVVAGGGAGLAAWHPWDRGSQVQLTLAERVQQAPDAQRYQRTLADGSTVTVVRSRSVGRAVVVTSNMAPAPSGKVYQLWLEAAGGSFVSAGLMPPGPNQTVVLDGDAASALGAGVSVEPSGGSIQPTTAPIVLFPFA